MPRTSRSAAMDTPTKRKSLPAGAYHQEPLPAGGYLRYRCPALDRAGAWFVQDRDPVTGKLAQTRLGEADDKQQADDHKVFDYAQARGAAEGWVKERFLARKSISSGASSPGKLRTVRDVFAYYIADAKQTRKAVKTAMDAEQAAAANILPELGDILVAELTADAIEAWRDKLADRGRRKTGWTRLEGEEVEYLPLVPKKAAKSMTKAQLAEATALAVKRRKSSTNRDLALLKAALNLAAEKGKIPRDHMPWAMVKLYRGVKGKRVRFLSVAEQVRLVNSCPSDFRQLVQGALFTGARYGDLTGALVKDFDISNGSLRFDRKGKDTNIGHVYLTEEGTAFFRELVAGRAPSELMFLRHDVERGSRKDAKNAEGWLKDDVKSPMRRACIAAQIEPLVFYELRHTYASSLIAKGVPLMIVAQQLGQKSTRMVEEHYGHLAPNATKDTIRALAPTLGITEPGKVAELKIQI